MFDYIHKYDHTISLFFLNIDNEFNSLDIIFNLINIEN